MKNKNFKEDKRIYILFLVLLCMTFFEIGLVSAINFNSGGVTWISDPVFNPPVNNISQNCFCIDGINGTNGHDGANGINGINGVNGTCINLHDQPLNTTSDVTFNSVTTGYILTPSSIPFSSGIDITNFGLISSTNHVIFNWNTGIFKDNNDNAIMNIFVNSLYYRNHNQSLDWENSYLIDKSNIQTLDWNGRSLIGNWTIPNVCYSNGTNCQTTNLSSYAVKGTTALFYTNTSMVLVTNSTYRMLGLGKFVNMTPTTSGNIRFHLDSNIVILSSASNGINVKIAYGTGTAPSNFALATGTTIGTILVLTNPATLVNFNTAFSRDVIIKGLTLNTNYWVDLQISANTATNTTETLTQIETSLEELPY